MLQIIYIFAFTVIALLAIANLIRSLITLSTDSQKVYPNLNNPTNTSTRLPTRQNPKLDSVVKRPIHPELLDEKGRIINEPLLVMRSVSVEDARQQLDSLYNSSPSKSDSEE